MISRWGTAGTTFSLIAALNGCGSGGGGIIEPENRPPSIGSVQGPVAVKTGVEAELTVSCSDPDGDPTQARWSPAPARESNGGDMHRAVYVFDEDGKHDIAVRCLDTQNAASHVVDAAIEAYTPVDAVIRITHSRVSDGSFASGMPVQSGSVLVDGKSYEIQGGYATIPDLKNGSSFVARIRAVSGIEQVREFIAGQDTLKTNVMHTDLARELLESLPPEGLWIPYRTINVTVDDGPQDWYLDDSTGRLHKQGEQGLRKVHVDPFVALVNQALPEMCLDGYTVRYASQNGGTVSTDSVFANRANAQRSSTDIQEFSRVMDQDRQSWAIAANKINRDGRMYHGSLGINHTATLPMPLGTADDFLEIFNFHPDKTSRYVNPDGSINQLGINLLSARNCNGWEPGMRFENGVQHW